MDRKTMRLKTEMRVPGRREKETWGALALGRTLD